MRKLRPVENIPRDIVMADKTARNINCVKYQASRSIYLTDMFECGLIYLDKKFIIYFGVLRKIWTFGDFIKRWDR